MTKFFGKLSAWLSAFAVLLCATALAGDLKFTYEIVQPCVPGVTGYSQAVIDLYVTTGSVFGLGAATVTLEPITGVVIDPTEVVWDSDTITIIPGTNDPVAKTLSSGKLQLQVKVPAINTPCVKASASAQHLCTIYADVDSSLAGELVVLPFGITAATGYSSTDSISLKNWLSEDSIASVDFDVNKSFNFRVAKGAIFETDEDTEMTIDAADSTKFEATAWDTASSTLKPTTNVKFVNVSPIDASVGTIGVTAGYELIFRPAANWNGDVDIHAVAKSITIADTNTPVDFTITVNPVSDPLDVVLTANNLAAVEGEAVSGTLTLTATDVDGGKSLTGATVTLGDSFLTITGTFEPQGTDAGVTTYLFTANGPSVPYTAVVHPADSADYDLTVVVTDGTDQYELADTVTVADTDQEIPSVDFAVNGESAALEVTADATLTAEGSAEDPDEEDVATVAVQWSEDGTTWGSTQPALAKGLVIYAKGVATSSYALKAYSVDSATVTVTVENSAPVVPVTNGSVFVLRHEDKSTPEPGVATFTATDADGLDDLLLCVEPTRSAEPAATTEIDLAGIYGDAHVAVANGTITFTYTVKDSTVQTNDDTEETLTFYVTDASEEDFLQVDVKCTFQENPLPVLAAATTKVNVAEVDAEGNPTAFEVAVTATDTNVYPAGVSSWAITVPEGWTYEAGDQTTGSVDEGTWEGSATWTVTTAGYDTITGSPRDASAPFAVVVSAIDVATAGEGTLEFEITAEDVDRVPSAPASVALAPAEPVHGDAITAAPAGATDEDGDAITGYTYAWSYSEDGTNFTALAETTDTLNDAAAIKKGYTVKVTAFAVSEPYTGT
ncbi:MAG: hypothetical protein II943_03415 [Victivallales bacterium]|nr:hypothetical protein [Victivallales bacterium]